MACWALDLGGYTSSCLPREEAVREISAVLVLSLSLLFFELAFAQPGAEPVRIAHAQDFAPLAEVKDGKSEGLAVDILRAAAARSGMEVKFVPVPFGQVRLTLEDGRAEAAFPLAITPERRQEFDFTEGLVITGAALYVRVPNVPPENLSALSGKIVVTPRTGPLAAFHQENCAGGESRSHEGL